MKTFVSVVSSGSFSEAARNLARSKAAVSQTISTLERDLGVTLLHRTTRSLRLTEAGQSYHRGCVNLLGEIESLESATKAERVSLSGRIRVTAPNGFAARYLGVLTGDFHKKQPDVVIDLRLSNRMVDLVAEGIDIAIRITNPVDSSLLSRKLASAPLVAVASPAYLERSGTPDKPTDLRHHACLIDTNFRDQNHWRFRQTRGKPNTVQVQGPFHINSPTALRTLALAGHGIAMIPLFLVDQDICDGSLRELLPGQPDFSWSIYALYPSEQYVPSRVRAYLDHLSVALAKPSPSTQATSTKE